LQLAQIAPASGVPQFEQNRPELEVPQDEQVVVLVEGDGMGGT
jgi:hypothetical protein